MRGYALSELLVAVAIAGLIIGTLTFLNVDYISLGRRAAEIQSPYAMGARVQAGDPCADPGGVLTAGENQVMAKHLLRAESVLTLSPQNPQAPGGPTEVTTPTGVAGVFSRPVRAVIEAAPPVAGQARGPSMASLEVGGATVAVVAPRCDLPQICDYDASNAMCAEDEVEEVAEPG
jgi:hypothetical protein